MDYAIDRLFTHIDWVLDKPTKPDWSDIRRNAFGHTFYWIHDGKGVFTADREYIVEGGTLAYLKPGLPLFMRSDQNNPLQMTMILFDCALYSRDAQGWIGMKSVPLLKLPFLRKYGKVEAARTGDLFRKAASSWVPGEPEGEAMSKTFLQLILVEAHRKSNFREFEDLSLEQKLEQVRTYLERYYYEDIRIFELASRFGQSVSHLRKTFKLKYGVGPKQYLSAVRNGHAIRHLLYSDAPIGEIATACGFQDVFHFSKAFKAANGQSPAAYRVLMRRKEEEPEEK